MNFVRSLLAGVLLLAFGGNLLAAEPAGDKGTEPKSVSYYREIRPIFVQNCQGCHQPAKASGGYVMTSYAAILKKGDTEEAPIVPGKPQESLVVAQITSQDGQPPVMPRGKEPLPAQQVNLIKKWIEQG